MGKFKMNKKTLNLMFITVVLVGSISFGVNAAIADIFRTGLTPIEDFFTGGWQNYEKTVSFIVFFFLFFSTYLIGMKRAFKELSRAHTVFAFTAAFLSAFIIVISMKFDWVNLKYVGWGLIVILILFLIYSILSKLLGKHKFLAFILALIITALLLWLIWYLMSEGRPLEGWGRVSNWFGTLGKGIGTGKGEKEGEVKTDLWPGGTPAKEGGGGGGGGGLGKYGLIIIVVVASITAGAGSIGKLRGKGFLGGIKDFYGYPFSAHKGTYRHAKLNWILKERLKKYIADVLEILKDPRLTEEERRNVELRLREAIKTVDEINNKWVNPRIKFFEKRQDKVNRTKEGRLGAQSMQTTQAEQSS